MKEAKVSAALLTGNTDIITRIVKNATYNNSKLSINWKSWVGLFPYGANVVKAANLIDSCTLKIDSSTSNTITQSAYIADYKDLAYKTTRDYTYNMKPGIAMKYQGDQLGMTITVRKPTDYKKFYTYYTGTKYIGYRFEFTIYDMNTKKSYDVDNNIQRTYK